MTRQRDFKKLVRARMARTQERYAAARAALLGELARTSPPRARHDQTFALRRLLGEDAPSEAWLLGLGGGISAQYHAFEYAGAPPLVYVGTRANPQYAYNAQFCLRALAGLGLDAVEATTGSAKKAGKDLSDALERGPAIAWVGREVLFGRTAPGGDTPWTVVVHDVDGEVAGVEDAFGGALEIPLERLAAARAAVKKQKHRLLFVDRTAPRPARPEAVRAALARCVADLDGEVVPGGSARNFGLSALEKWCGLMTNERDGKGWPRLFGRGAGLLDGLRQIYAWVGAASDGAGFRPMYAEFLREAHARLGGDALAAAAAQVAANGDQWRGLVDDAFTGPPVLAAARRALEDADAPQDPDALARLAGPADAELDERVAADLRERLHARLTSIVEGERRARDALARCTA